MSDREVWDLLNFYMSSSVIPFYVINEPVHRVNDHSFIEDDDGTVDNDYFEEDMDENDDGEDNEQVSLDSEGLDELREEGIEKPGEDDIFIKG